MYDDYPIFSISREELLEELADIKKKLHVIKIENDKLIFYDEKGGMLAIERNQRITLYTGVCMHTYTKEIEGIELPQLLAKIGESK
jgi:hypothetical protein